MKIEPWGIVAEILSEMTKEEFVEEDLLNIMRREQKSKATMEEMGAMAVDLNQVVDGENSTLLHIVVKKNLLDLVW